MKRDDNWELIRDEFGNVYHSHIVVERDDGLTSEYRDGEMVMEYREGIVIVVDEVER